MKSVGILLVTLVFLIAGCDIEAESPGHTNLAPASSNGTETTEDVGGSSVEPKVRTTVSGTELSLLTIKSSGKKKAEVWVEIADNSLGRLIGLRGRENLPESQGMLFIFEDEVKLSFTMQDTLIPLSIAFIDSKGRIVDLQNMEPSKTGYISAEPAQYALEVNQGFFEERGVEVGNTAKLPG